ncbi:Crp/Fnr family transcriptional regulator [Lactococcus cremoris]|uniref:Crp/Fnr family transcriptional regulator n=1 Tax=Lactococcus lactis subsp. cremoris TaxID=1359 RepID=UPI000583972A|nr:Crp/Fnr family transcriptional regulator [Lactococcus cremoris]KGH33616.1 Crp/Fnr family transcriptional regulator [Lactococcus cremoris]QSE64698.1 Crp/Fnr family transcriptional regulator [Lactococcus cremoris]
MEIENCVHHVNLFNHLTQEEQNKIYFLLHHKSFLKGEIIFSPDSEEQLSIISSGRMKIYNLKRNGKEQLIRIIEEGDCEGESSLFDTDNKTLYGEALTKTEVCILYKSDFKKLIEKNPAISYKLLYLSFEKIKKLEKQAYLLSFNKIEDRLALYLINLFKSTGILDEIIILDLPLKEIANYIGTSSEVLSRQFKAFEMQGWIVRTGKKIIIKEAFWNIFKEF